MVLRCHLCVLGPHRHSRMLGPCHHSRVLGPRCHSCVVGPHRRSRMLGPCRRSRVLGPCCRSCMLGSCCHSRLLVLGPCQVIVHHVRLSFVVVWLVVFGLWWLWLPSHCRCPLSRLHALLMRDGVVLWVVLGHHCRLWLVCCHSCLWMLVGTVGHHGVWMPAGGSDYVGEGGGAHRDQQQMTNRFVVHHLVATSLTAMWHLVSLSEKKKEEGVSTYFGW